MSDKFGVVEVAFQIQKRINEIDKIRSEIRERGNAKAKAIVDYEKALAKVLIQLKNGVTFEFEGQKISRPQASYMKEIAKGLCAEKKIEMESAEMAYKSCIVNLEAAQAQLNASQSIYRHLSNN